MSNDTFFEKEHSVPLVDSLGFCSVGVDTSCEPIATDYWIPVEDHELVEMSYPPKGHVIQYPKDDKEPNMVGKDSVPDGVTNWDYREEDNE